MYDGPKNRDRLIVYTPGSADGRRLAESRASGETVSLWSRNLVDGWIVYCATQ